MMELLVMIKLDAWAICGTPRASLSVSLPVELLKALRMMVA
jgi:hypothetical protein